MPDYRKQACANSHNASFAPLLTGREFMRRAINFARAIGTMLLVSPYLFCLCVAYLTKSSR
jgi:hypothetical protein